MRSSNGSTRCTAMLQVFAYVGTGEKFSLLFKPIERSSIVGPMQRTIFERIRHSAIFFPAKDSIACLVRRTAHSVASWPFERIYSGFPGGNVMASAKAAVERPTSRYVDLLNSR